MSRLEQRVDLLTEALLQISSDLWSTRDRLMVLEEVLVQAGINAPKLVDDHTPSPELEARLKAERESFIARLMDLLSTAESPASSPTIERLPSTKPSDDFASDIGGIAR